MSRILEGAADLENLKGSQFNNFFFLFFSHEFSSNFPHNKVFPQPQMRRKEALM